MHARRPHPPGLSVNKADAPRLRASRNAEQLWWRVRDRALDMGVNEAELCGFQRFGRHSFQRRSKP